MLAPLGTLLTQDAGERAGPHPPPAVTLPSLREGGVTRALATIFTQPIGGGAFNDDAPADAPEAYDPEDPATAREAGLRQLRVYQRWRHEANVTIGLRSDGPRPAERPVTPPRTGPVTAEPGGGRRGPAPTISAGSPVPEGPPLSIGVLMENADPITSPDELAWWVERGVVAVGLAWATPSRYAGGNGTDEPLTDLGEAMVRAMDDLGVVHDLSHLSDPALADVLDRANGPVIASHSNCRALLGGNDPVTRATINPQWQRHLSDTTIVEIAERGGVIGLNLCAPFVAWPLGRGERPTVSAAVSHIEHICELAGGTHAVGLGSDMDGGFSAAHLPAGIDRPSDLALLADALAARGWGDDEIDAFRFGNWARVFGAA